MHILVINCGSSSIKYQVINTVDESCLKKGAVEKVGTETSIENALQQVMDTVAGQQIDAIGHRVVHGGDEFNDATLINDEVIERIEQWNPLAPLHNPFNLKGIEAAKALFPDLPHVAVFDTAFHAQMPTRASSYAIDKSIADELKIKRYGFHGTSHSYVCHKAASFLNAPMTELRMVSLHLGNGASACAVEMGHSTETSMGMTPLEGLVMGTRAGDIDPGAILHLMREGKYSIDEVDSILNRKSGLAGLSGISNDLREIEKAAEAGDSNARSAIASFAHRVRKYIGAYAATMGGVDTIVLTGGIGENSATMRRRILQRLGFLGVVIDDDLNSAANVYAEQPVVCISEAHSRVKVLVVKTNEELMIAKQTAAIANDDVHVENPGPIPIAVSARHIHLAKETFYELFGKDAELTHYKDLSQPGQFAAQEKLNIIGPRNRIDGVRILGPLRSKNQIEISRTDEFVLGVDAPVRDSGRVKGSAPITLEGPKGTVHLEEGLICARRHIHMHPDDAKRYGVAHNEEVAVAITGGPRDLVFGDVLVRVSPAYQLEMHIDTDEANAAELCKESEATMAYTEVHGAKAMLQSKHTNISD